jgi:MOSC domain-containing protein YiiM
VPGTIIQVSVSRGGVPKRSISEGEITTLGIVGDEHANPQIHGGPLQAILMVTMEGLDELATQGFPLYPGALGENLTTRGLDRRSMRIGQRYRTPNAILQITKMREPCNTLSVYGPGIQHAVFDAQVKAGDFSSPRWGLAGFYASVIQTGIVRPGDPITLLEEVA